MNRGDDERDGVALTNLDQPLFDGAGVTKRQLVDYLDAVADRLVPVLAGRALSVIRARPGQAPFMQKNLPRTAPPWLARVPLWAETSQRTVTYGCVNDRRSLLWFANQRAVEYHPTLVHSDHPHHLTHLVIDLDPPEGRPFAEVVAAARLARRALQDVGLDAAVKTSGAKGLHLFVPVAPADDGAAAPADDGAAEHDPWRAMEDAAGALRAIAARIERLDPDRVTTAFLKDDRAGKVFVDATRVGGATVVAAYSPRARPGVPVSYPLAWDELDDIEPGRFTVTTAIEHLAGRDPWLDTMPAPQTIPAVLVEEGRSIPVPRVAAMHEGKRRRRAARAKDDAGSDGT
ncbi:MAG: DNA polymerase domain-containing protein [Acidimicrobiia bacterium]